MFAQDYLALRLYRVKGREEWSSKGQGLAFILPSAGAGQLISAAGILPFRAGDVVVVNDGLEGKVCVADGSEVVFWSFCVNVEHLYPLFANDEISLVQGLQDQFERARVYAAGTPVPAECHRLVASVPPQFNLDHRSHLLRIVATVLSAEMNKARPNRCGFVQMDEHLNTVFEKLSLDEILSLSVGELAERFGCNRRHLNRLFHQRFGCSVAALTMEMRLLKAASLFRDSNAKVISVAENCGFNHLGFFNTCFKRRFGVSPGQWKKQSSHGECSPKSLMSSSDPQCRLRTTGLCPWAGIGGEQSSGQSPTAFTRSAAAGVHQSGQVKVDGNRSASGKPQSPRPVIRIRIRTGERI